MLASQHPERGGGREVGGPPRDLAVGIRKQLSQERGRVRECELAGRGVAGRGRRLVVRPILGSNLGQQVAGEADRPVAVRADGVLTLEHGQQRYRAWRLHSAEDADVRAERIGAQLQQSRDEGLAFVAGGAIWGGTVWGGAVSLVSCAAAVVILADVIGARLAVLTSRRMASRGAVLGRASTARALAVGRLASAAARSALTCSTSAGSPPRRRSRNASWTFLRPRPP